MIDYGHQATEKELKILESRIKSVYTEAKSDINKKMKDFNARHAKKQAVMKDKLKKGLITKDEYQSWMKGQVFQGNQWKLKKEQIIGTLQTANVQALALANAGKVHVFIGNSNYMAYTLEHTAGVNFGFNLYDTKTVGKLIKEQPDLLPNKHLDKVKDGAWNRKKITRQVTLGIIEGEGLDDVAKRLGEVCDQDWRAMRTSARTAMTSAQNAGRQARLEEAEKKGIKLHKEWMATFDMHTRDAHRELDGQKVPVDKPFKVDGYEIMYPADPHAEGFLVYNCRCSMVADLDDFPEVYQRYDNIDGKPVSQMTYKEWIKAKTVTEEVDGVDYSEVGGKEVYDIISKYPDWDTFYDKSTDDELDAFELYAITSGASDSQLKETFEELKEKSKKMPSPKVDDAKETVTAEIDYSEFGGKTAFEDIAKFKDIDEWIDFGKADYWFDKWMAGEISDDELDTLIKKAHALAEKTKASAVKGVTKEIDYSEFGGKEVYDIGLKYGSLSDLVTGTSFEEFEKFFDAAKKLGISDRKLYDKIRAAGSTTTAKEVKTEAAKKIVKATENKVEILGKTFTEQDIMGLVGVDDDKLFDILTNRFSEEEIEALLGKNSIFDKDKLRAFLGWGEQSNAKPRLKAYLDNLSENVALNNEKSWVVDDVKEQIEEIAKSIGKSIDETKDILDSSIKQIVDNSDMIMRIKPHNLELVLNDGYFKNQFEVGHSGGAYIPSERRDLEFRKFNVPKNNSSSMSDGDRPVYGMLAPKYDAGNSEIVGYYKSGAGAWYGGSESATVVLKKDNVINNATMTIGDSLDYDYHLYGTELNNPTYCGSYGGSWTGEKLATYNENATSKEINEKLMNVAKSGDHYFEYQLHGKESHSIDNIDKVYLHGNRAKYADLVDLLENAGIPYEFYN